MPEFLEEPETRLMPMTPTAVANAVSVTVSYDAGLRAAAAPRRRRHGPPLGTIAGPLTYARARELLRGARDGVKVIANNTYLALLGAGLTGVFLHDTCLVAIHPDGSYTLRSGGYRTRTTLDRINRYAPVTLRQRAWQWQLSYRDHRNGERRCIPFAEGMRVDLYGAFVSYPDLTRRS